MPSTWLNLLPGEPLADYPTLFFFEVGEWWDYAMLLVVIVTLAGTAWLTIRYRWAVAVFFIAAPVGLTIFWWPHSTEGTTVSGWFLIVKQYSALIGSLSLAALQIFPKLRRNRWYLLIPPILLAVNIVEAVVRDLQCYYIHGSDTNGSVLWGGPWNIMNAVAGILNILAISGWVGIFVSKRRDHAIIWGDLTILWIVGYDLWNFAYCYNCLSDRSWYAGFALLASCTIPACFKWGRGAWIHYRAYTLTLWSGFMLTVPGFVASGIFEHRSAHNPVALFLVSLASLVANVILVVYHVSKIVRTKRNPATMEVYGDTPTYVSWVAYHATAAEQDRIATRLGSTAEKLGYR
ncbi:hypothetical protein FYZ41_05240 [Mobiluncus mulieris]|uniref:DUF5692 family protein n=1 Tax=Mobiluncus mulieris TaxID=2052 RepID=UPI0021E2994B|nr:DUF5692 family protein [Mobiluncus mulieris]MCV0011581.1 hypothetical protein [Mobiluncus mulieris]